jgi:hypothetical protein
VAVGRVGGQVAQCEQLRAALLVQARGLGPESGRGLEARHLGVEARARGRGPRAGRVPEVAGLARVVLEVVELGPRRRDELVAPRDDAAQAAPAEQVRRALVLEVDRARLRLAGDP